MTYSNALYADPTLAVQKTRQLRPADNTLTLERPRQLELSPAPRRPLEIKLGLPPATKTLKTAESSQSASFLKWVRANLSWAISAGILGANLAFHAPLFVVGAGMTGLTLQIVRAIIRRTPALQRLLKTALTRIGLTDARIPAMTAGVGAGAWLSVAMPSQALFFSAAETYFKTTFGVTSAATAEAVAMVFGILRIIFVLYLGIALVRVINAFRNDEDWQTAARIPMMVVLCIVLGDVLSAMIVN